MNLRDYLPFNRKTVREFARELEIHPNYLSLIKTGKLQPGIDLCIRIEMLTDGQVTVQDLKTS